MPRRAPFILCMKDSQKKKWDAFYSSTKREDFLHLSDQQLDAILKEFPTAKTILDIGCGEGQLLTQLTMRGYDVTGIDVSPIALSRVDLDTTIITGDFENYRFGQTFDIIFAKFLVAFIENLPNFFAKTHSLLNRDGGMVIISPIVDGEKDEEIFIKKEDFENGYRTYFDVRFDTSLYQEGNKRLAQVILTKRG